MADPALGRMMRDHGSRFPGRPQKQVLVIMTDFSQLMKQAQEMQAKMAEIQSELGNMEILGRAVGGLVTVTLSGKGDMKNLTIDPSLIKPDEADILEDLIVAAHADARGKMEVAVAEKMKQAAGGLQLPPGLGF